jgi:hypothetical protein
MNAENAEKNLWDQIRSLTQISVRLAQWGIGTLLGLLTAIFFLRKETFGAFPGTTPGHPLFFWRFVTGNLFLWFVAVLFYRMSKWIRRRIFYYIAKLRELPQAYPSDNVKLYPEFPPDGPVTQAFWRRAIDLFKSNQTEHGQTLWHRIIDLFKLPNDNRAMGVHIGTLFFFVPIADCILYGLQWVFWWFQ